MLTFTWSIAAGIGWSQKCMTAAKMLQLAHVILVAPPTTALRA
ncbi:MAG: hypothetical protein ACJA1G_000377 [Qipengyuania sp.]|jgi:hypothetical protein